MRILTIEAGTAEVQTATKQARQGVNLELAMPQELSTMARPPVIAQQGRHVSPWFPGALQAIFETYRAADAGLNHYHKPRRKTS